MKTPEDEAFDDLARRQGAWGGGFKAKQAMAADKMREPDEALTLEALKYAASMGYRLRGTKFGRFTIKEALAQPAQEPDALTIAYQSGYHDGKKAALAGREWNFCERCGKRTADKTLIHTCTPPQGAA